MGIWKKKFSVRDNAERGEAAEDLFAYRKGVESEEEVKKTKTPDFTTGEDYDEVKMGEYANESKDQKKFREDNPDNYNLNRMNFPGDVLDRKAFDKYGLLCPRCGGSLTPGHSCE